MCSNVESMVQDEIPVQDIPINVQVELPPQINSEPEMGAAAAEAAVYDTSPSLLRNPPPIPAETAHPRAPGVAQLFAMLTKMTNGINNKMDEMSKNMDAHTKTLRDEMRRVGQCLQAGIMAAPRAGANELRGSATAVRPAMEAGEDKIRRETCRTRLVKVTERVTEREKLNGETETCETRYEVTTAELIIETREVMGDEVTELAETREIEGELDGVKDEHTHRVSGGQWGRAGRTCWDPVQAAG